MNWPHANPAAGAAPPATGVHEINAAFNRFLRITDDDKARLARHRERLRHDAGAFVDAFYAYLSAFPNTAAVLKQYQGAGGRLYDLAARQSAHFLELLDGPTDAPSAKRLMHIGDVHFRFGIEPVWIMGAYQLYLDHLRNIITGHTDIAVAEREALEGVLIKLLFRDMGLMLQGYWDAAMALAQRERERAEALRSQVNDLLANLPQVLWSVDVRRNEMLYLSPGTRDICKVDPELPIPCMAWTHPDDHAIVGRAWEDALRGHRVEVESRVQAPGESARWFRRVFQPVHDEAGDVVRIDGLMDDTTESRAQIERLQTLATTDCLTELPNRTLLFDRLAQAIALAKREPERQAVLMFMDLDHFKEINDTLGHPAGDEVLRQVAQRLGGALRESDTLARLGGDEFAILLADPHADRESAATVAGHLLECFHEPFWFQHNELYLGAGIGIALFPDHGANAGELMSRADVAMYCAKRAGAGYLFYDPANDPHTHERLQLASDLRHALERDEFVLHYQPQIDLASGRVVGVEALIRWNHPVHGMIAPDSFIPFAEKTGLIGPITEWVMREAVGQARRWRAESESLRVSINVTARSFEDPLLPDKLASLLGEADAFLPAEGIEIEITENMLMADIEHGARAIGRLRELGVKVSIDDFGTGYSSLAYLKRLPIHAIKIDKSFVLNMTGDENDAVIVRSTIDLAHNLGYLVVAEGVEHADALALLGTLGCDLAQGYFVSRPLPAPALTQWLRERRGASTRAPLARA